MGRRIVAPPTGVSKGQDQGRAGTLADVESIIKQGLEFFNKTTKYGPLAEAVKNAGFAMAAGAAIAFAWMPRRGSRWVPPDEAVSKGTASVGVLVTAVGLVVMYTFLGSRADMPVLGALLFLLTMLTVFAFLRTTRIIKQYGYKVETRGLFGFQRSAIKLGGTVLTDEAAKIVATRHVDWARLVTEAQGEMTLVFTQASIAEVHSKATSMYLALQIFGSLALGAAGRLLSLV